MALDWTLSLLQDWYKMGLEDMGEPFVSSLKEGVPYPPYTSPSLSSFVLVHLPPVPPQTAQMPQNINMDCLGFLESTACFDLKAGTTSPLLGAPPPTGPTSLAGNVGGKGPPRRN